MFFTLTLLTILTFYSVYLMLVFVDWQWQQEDERREGEDA